MKKNEFLTHIKKIYIYRIWDTRHQMPDQKMPQNIERLQSKEEKKEKQSIELIYWIFAQQARFRDRKNGEIVQIVIDLFEEMNNFFLYSLAYSECTKKIFFTFFPASQLLRIYLSSLLSKFTVLIYFVSIL